jgi:5-dehydro-2-deoxygluconokinase
MSGDQLPELLTIGRIGVDIYGQELGQGLEDQQTFAKAVGGSATNVAVAAARLGHRAAVLTKVGDDSLGTYAIRDCEALGVDTRWITRMSGGRTAVVLTGLENPGDPELVFYRDGNTPDLQLTSADLSDDVARSVDVLWYTGSALSREPSTSTVLHALQVRERREHVIYDLDYRPSFWNSRDDATAAIGAAIDYATITIGNREECSVALGMPIDSKPEDFAAGFLDRGVKVAIVKQGADGVLVVTADERVVVPGIPVDVVCGLGAGDAFGGSFVHGILSGWSPADSVTYANAAGAIVASRLLCSHAMPTDAEVRELLAAAGRKVPA